MNFEHDYYKPTTEGKRIPTVLCMCCEKTVRSNSLTREEMLTLYKEKKVQWDLKDGGQVNGVVILCPVCVEKNIDESDYPKILNQINRAFTAEAEFTRQEVDTTLVGATLIGEA